MPTLEIRFPGGMERVHPLEGERVAFGRLSSNDVVLDARGISREHGRLMCDADGRWWIEDLNSTNGTLIAGRYVTRHLLRHNDTIQVGEVMLTFRRDPPGSVDARLAPVTLCEGLGSTQSTLERSPEVAHAIMDGQRLAALYEVSKRLMDQRDVEGLIDEASSALISMLNAEVVVFGMTCDPEHENERMVVRAIRPQDAGVTLSRSVLRRTIDAQRAILVSDTSTDLDLVVARSIIAGGINSALCVPMMRGPEITGFIYVDSRHRNRSYDENDLQFACAVGAMVGTAVENARLHEAELVKQRMEAELASARRVQQAIMPSSWPQIPGWDVYGAHATCREVGGDYYDAIHTPDGRLWLIVADVAGKGVPAALLASCVYASVQPLVDQCHGPSELLARLNSLLLRRGLDQPFVTCLVAMVTLSTGDTLIASAGHPHPIYIDPAGPAHEIELAHGLILGCESDVTFTDTTWSFPAKGGTLLMYTDGVSEAMDDRLEQFGTERLIPVISKKRLASASDLVNTVLHAVDSFRGRHPQTDDLALVSCRREPIAG